MTVTVNFEANGAVTGLGGYKSMINIMVPGTEIHMSPPNGWICKGINVYDVGCGPFLHSEKHIEMNMLRWPQTDWASVFSRSFPLGFSYGGTVPRPDFSTLVDFGANNNSYEYLVWIQNSEGVNDFVDPDVKTTI